MKISRLHGAFERRPFLFIAAAFAAGIASSAAVPIPLWFAIPVVLLSFGCAWLSPRASLASTFLILVGAAFAGIAAIDLSTPAADRLSSMIDGGIIASGETPVRVHGTVRREPEDAMDGQQLEIEAESVMIGRRRFRASGAVRLFAAVRDEAAADEYATLALAYGDEIEVTCRLDRREEFLNPGTMTRLATLDAQGIDATGIIKSPLLIKKKAGGAFGGMRLAYEARRRLIAEFRRTLGAGAGGVMIASLLGNKRYLDRNTADLFREGGTFHVLVISGLHITFLGGLLIAGLRWLRFGGIAQLAVGGALIWSYALAVGGEVPVVRAALMFTAILAGRVFYRDPDLLNLFGMCAFLILLFDPDDLFSPSLQLTFMSVWALVGIAFPLIGKLRDAGEWRPNSETPFPPSVSTPLRMFCEALYWRDEIWSAESARNVWTATLPKLKRAWRRLPRAGAFLFEAITVSLIVQLAMLPLSVVYFNRISVGSVILNIWVSFLLGAETFAAIGAVAMSAISGAAAVPLVSLTDVLNRLMLWLPSVFSDLGIAGYRVPSYSGFGRGAYILYFIPVGIIAWRINAWDPFALVLVRNRYRTMIVVGLMCAILLMLFHPFVRESPSGRLQVDFLDVGQGDAALVTFPDGATMLIDGGGRPEYGKRGGAEDTDEEPFEPDRIRIGEAVVSKFLWKRGLSRIDYLVATHADADHIQGLSDIVKNFSVGRAFHGRYAPDDEDFAEFESELAKHGVPFGPLRSGDVLEVAGARVEVVHPDPGSPLPNGNDDSVVLRISYGTRSVLLTGDIETAGEQAIIATGGRLRSDVVKVAHHGSRTSSIESFIRRTKPSVAIVSVGLDSPFGHPDPEVVERWRAGGADVLVTGQSGTVTISTDGADLQVGRFADGQ